MLSYNLVIAGIVALGLYALTNFIQVFRKQAKVGCWSHFLVLIALAAFLASFLLNQTSDEINPLTEPLTLGTIAALIAVSAIIYILERRHEQFSHLFSRGILGLGAGLLLAAAFFFVPIVSSTIFPLPSPTPIAQAVAQSDSDITANIVPTAIVEETTPTPQMTLTPTATYTPLPSPSPTRTRRAYIPPTETPTPKAETVSEECDARVTVNLNVRSEPNTESEVVAIVPEGRFVNILGQGTVEEDWWRAEFEGTTGWVSGDFLELDEICLYGE